MVRLVRHWSGDGVPLKQRGAIGYVLAWLIGVPIPVLIIVALLRGVRLISSREGKNMPTSTVDQGTGALAREHPVMHWGAIFAGWFVATGTATVLYLFGLAVGLSAVDPHDVAGAARGVSAGAIVWIILTWGAALWIGGMFASWFDGRNDTEMGVVRGLTVWGLAMAATGLIVASGLAHLGSVASIPQAGVPAAGQAGVVHYTAAWMWAAFGSSVLSLLTSAFGGWVGAHHVHRVYHLRQYSVHGR